MQRVWKSNSTMNSFDGATHTKDDISGDELSRSALATYMRKEEEIQRKRTEIKDMVHNQLGRAEEATKRLADILDELEALVDPMRKEVGILRKRIDVVNRELRPLTESCRKKEKEYKQVLEIFNEKSKEKAQLVSTLMELVGESERLRMNKLEELSKGMDSLK
ncbi:hypothetical protein MLD38_003473 [Melastoma candidum]|uniref:Uncharacterized protein n=1 Tax=Melastoma candidum TaxID=119954 RepID=A0ACB9S2Y3_9MYRT|nr:hypothetical protein MLD38_003473 [Melastoma candidum]